MTRTMKARLAELATWDAIRFVGTLGRTDAALVRRGVLVETGCERMWAHRRDGDDRGLHYVRAFALAA